MGSQTINSSFVASLLREGYAYRTYDLKRSISLSARALEISKVIIEIDKLYAALTRSATN